MPSSGYPFDEQNNAHFQNKPIFANPPSSHCIPSHQDQHRLLTPTSRNDMNGQNYNAGQNNNSHNNPNSHNHSNGQSYNGQYNNASPTNGQHTHALNGNPNRSMNNPNSNYSNNQTSSHPNHSNSSHQGSNHQSSSHQTTGNHNYSIIPMGTPARVPMYPNEQSPNNTRPINIPNSNSHQSAFSNTHHPAFNTKSEHFGSQNFNENTQQIDFNNHPNFQHSSYRHMENSQHMEHSHNMEHSQHMEHSHHAEHPQNVDQQRKCYTEEFDCNKINPQNFSSNQNPSGSFPYDSGTAEDESPIYDLDENVDTYLNGFRVNQCQAFLQHKCNKHKPFTCFDWHFKNQRRRKPSILKNGDFNYSPDVYCTVYSETTGDCQNSDECPYLHRNTGDTERRYHLRYYKTQICNIETDEKTGNCIKNGSHCAYAHGSRQLRRPVYSAGGDVEVVPKLSPIVKCVSGETSGDSTPPNGNFSVPAPTTAVTLDVFQEITPEQELYNVSSNPNSSGSALLTMSNQDMSDHQKSLFNQQQEICREKIIPDDPRWADANFVQIHYKTEKCTKPPRLCRQGYACPYYHNPRDRRRSPKSFDYTSTACPNVKMGMDWKDPSQCVDGDNCNFCHTRTEQQFHHDIYKSNKCNDMQQSGYCPRGNFCAFAHVINTSRNSAASLSKGDSFNAGIGGISKHPHTEAMRNRIQSDSNLLRNFSTREHMSSMIRKVKSPNNDLAEQMNALGKPGDSVDSPPLTFRSKSIGQSTGIGIRNQIKSLRQKMPSFSENMKIELDDISGSQSSLGTQPRAISTSIQPIPESSLSRPPTLSEINRSFRNTISGGSMNNVGSTDAFDITVGRSPNTQASIFDDKQTTASSPIGEPADFGFSERFNGLEPVKALPKTTKVNKPLMREWSVQNCMYSSLANQSGNQGGNQMGNSSVSQSVINGSVSQSVIQGSVMQSGSQSVNQSGNQSMSQSIIKNDSESAESRDVELERMHKELKNKYACLQQQYDNLKVEREMNYKKSTILPTTSELSNLPKRQLVDLRATLQNTTSEIDKILLCSMNDLDFDRNNNKSPQSTNSQQLGSD